MPKAKKPHFKEIRTAGPTAAGGASSVVRLRKKIRDIERLLKYTASKSDSEHQHKEKNTMAVARREQERALSALKTELHEAEFRASEKTLEKKYQQVRFVERRKADRKIVKTRRDLAALASVDKADMANQAKVKELKKKLKTAEIELSYIVLFPIEKKYISLYVDNGLERVLSAGSDESESGTDKQRREWWNEISQKVKNGEVDVDSLLFGHSSGHKPRRPVPRKSTAEETNAVKEAEAVEEEDEFFEKN
ncbi:uncharacterized protein V1518DRAFT_440401 [Limtongia smithiae]|uniref:uncharacterized protein n=1 Tax=Limtongia smithiae TaxID=1125753 RepID=UPI0034CD57FA